MCSVLPLYRTILTSLYFQTITSTQTGQCLGEPPTRCWLCWVVAVQAASSLDPSGKQQHTPCHCGNLRTTTRHSALPGACAFNQAGYSTLKCILCNLYTVVSACHDCFRMRSHRAEREDSRQLVHGLASRHRCPLSLFQVSPAVATPSATQSPPSTNTVLSTTQPRQPMPRPTVSSDRSSAVRTN